MNNHNSISAKEYASVLRKALSDLESIPMTDQNRECYYKMKIAFLNNLVKTQDYILES